MSDGESIQVEKQGPIAHVWLNRPKKHNAFDDHMARELRDAFARLEQAGVRAVVLGGRGRSFCAGGDVEWMERVTHYGPEENLDDARDFQRTFDRIDRIPAVVIGRIHGAALGGGAGLVAVCDIVVASRQALLGFPESRLGLVPGVISPYVLRKIGPAAARRLFLTGESVDAAEARRLGLVHHVVDAAALDAEVQRNLDKVLKVAPDAVGRAKRLVRDLEHADAERAAAIAAQAIADARASDDGEEGTQAFLEKRKPRWRP